MSRPNPSVRERWLVWITHVLPAVIYVCAIFYAGLVRLGHLPEVGFMPTDKFVHALTFAGLAVLFVRALRALWPSFTRGRVFAGAVLLASFFGALLEVCQAFVPYRSAELLDWVADTIGAALAVGFALLIGSRSSRQIHG